MFLLDSVKPTLVTQKQEGDRIDWNSMGNVGSIDGNYAVTDSLNDKDISNTLIVKSFLLDSLPDNAIIHEVYGIIVRKSNWTKIIDNTVQFYSDTTPVSNNKAISTKWTTSDKTIVYGGDEASWGMELSPQVLKSSSFGFGINVTSTSSITSKAYVDCMMLRVYFDIPSVLPINYSAF